MTENLIIAKQLLEKENYTVVMHKSNEAFAPSKCHEPLSSFNEHGEFVAPNGGGAFFTSKERGIRPLIGFIDSGTDFGGSVVADKIVGKASALLHVLLKTEEIYAEVMSCSALEILKNRGIKAYFGTLTDGIRNRTNTGPCPMEAAVAETDDPTEALKILRETVAKMQADSVKQHQNRGTDGI